MPLYPTRLLNILVIFALILTSLLTALPASTSRAAGTGGPKVSASSDLIGPRARHKKHKDQKKERKKDRTQKDRKSKKKKRGKGQKKKSRKQRGKQLPSGVLLGADDPIGPDGKLNVADRYIIRLKPSAGDAKRATRAVSRDIAGVTPTHVYRHVFDGFAAVIPPEKVDDVRNDPRVAAVMPDFVVYGTAQTIPTGIRRSNADENPTADIDGNDERVDIDVAVIDTAGKGTHQDLNTHAWANCTPSHDNTDDHGHGTHVGGTIGALDNNLGVVGVAPGARLWNLRVLIALPDGRSSGLRSWIICGLDIATQYATDQGDGLGDIEVANLSLGGGGSDSNCQTNPSDLYHQAYCQTVAAGVTVVVSAGNSDVDAAQTVPATYEEVITVSALADSNGEPGGGGPDTSSGPDDTLALFSNWGPDIDIAAPGVDILSTVPTGSCALCDPSGYRKLNGTSMAAPHVAGGAALYLANNPGASPAQVKAALLAAREQVSLPNDPDGIPEGVLNVGAGFGQ